MGEKWREIPTPSPYEGITELEYKKALKLLVGARKDCFIPRMKKAGRLTAREAKKSRQGGIPWLEAGTKWPTCGTCGNALRFRFQLSLAELQIKGFTKRGILSSFFCDSDPCGGADLGDEDRDSQALIYISGVKGGLAPPPVDRSLDPALIVSSWKKTQDLLELDTLPGPLREKVRRELGDGKFQAFEEKYSEEYPVREDKAGGYPRWIQTDGEEPHCRFCKNGKNLVFVQQFPLEAKEESSGVLMYLFGCKKHQKHFVAVGEMD